MLNGWAEGACGGPLESSGGAPGSRPERPGSFPAVRGAVRAKRLHSSRPGRALHGRSEPARHARLDSSLHAGGPGPGHHVVEDFNPYEAVEVIDKDADSTVRAIMVRTIFLVEAPARW